jgi:hypothetical protein
MKTITRYNRRWLSSACACLLTTCALATAAPVVEIEEDVYTYEPANNGAGPMWCQGSTCLVRVGQELFASGLETLVHAKPLNNCRWMLFRREEDRWVKVATDTNGRTREPCPLVGFQDGRLFLSANPTLVSNPESYSGPSRPEILEFAVDRPRQPWRTHLPMWTGDPKFTEHSYRSFAADGRRGEMILFQNVGYTHAEWAFLDRQSEWSARGQLKWPWGADYAKPQPIRVCYPNVAVRDLAVHFCGVSDIIEPNPEWRAYKKKLTGRDWDYDFRRLFYTWTPDITREGFRGWVELASREATCGWITPGDLHVTVDGSVHVLWTERALDERLREEFFPTEKQRHALEYALVKDGRVIRRRTVWAAEEGKSKKQPGRGRFHVTPDGRLFVLFYLSGTDDQGRGVSENRLLEMRDNVSPRDSVIVPLQRPFVDFFTTTVRGGSPPSGTIELLGVGVGSRKTLSYARIRLAEEAAPRP